MTHHVVMHALRVWSDFLRRRGVDSDAVTIRDVIAWERELVEDGFTAGDLVALSSVRSYYLLKASQDPESRWAKLAAELKVHQLPKKIGKAMPFKPLPLAVLPQVLEASRHVRQFKPAGKTEVYSEAFAVTATFVYTGGRAQWYALTDDQAEAAIDAKYVELFVKEGEHVVVPVHDKLLAIWREHMDRRDHEGPSLFRHGRNPYQYQDGSKDWKSDLLAAKSNERNVERILTGAGERKDSVGSQLLDRFGVVEQLTSHRIRKSVGTFMEQYGFTESERRLQLSHGAKSITAHYSAPQVLEVQRKISKMDLGSVEWVAAHDPPSNLFANGNGSGVDQDLVQQLLAENRDLRKKLEQLLERKVVA